MVDALRLEDWTALAPDGVGACHYGTVESTNILAADAELLPQEYAHWHVASGQSAGRGRRGREWISPEGNFYGSLRQVVDKAHIPLLPFAVSLAIAESLEQVGISTDEIAVKWPNDVLVGERKIAGVLIELLGGTAKQDAVIGIGVNLASAPHEAQFPATSVYDEIASAPVLRSYFSILSAILARELADLTNADRCLMRWRGKAWGFGAWQTIKLQERCFEAELVALMEDGGLRVRLQSGEEEIIHVGDIFPSRANS